MPATTYNATTGVKVALDRVHKGPGQAGNKSALTYRCDIGVPGYTGYIPQTAAMPLQTKGSTQYIGRGCTIDTDATSVPDFHTTSWYQKQFQADPAAYHKPRKDNGGYWIAQGCETASRPFSASSTYQAELQHGGPTAHHQLAPTVGLRGTVSCYDAARRGASNGTIRAVPASVRQPLGFRTMYSSMHGEQLELSQAYAPPLPPHPSHTTAPTAASPATAAATAVAAAAAADPAAAARTATAVTASTLPKTKVLQVTSPIGHAPVDAASRYTSDLGGYGHDPLVREVGAARDMTTSATTTDLAAGTARATRQLPGYTGFVPESDHNALACWEASAETQPRRDDKTSKMLFDMDQYSRQRVPLYTGHRARALANLSVVEPANGPTLQTTQGYANFLATQRPHTVDNSNFINSKKGIMSFFNAGSSLFASDNGMAEAQKFYQSKRGREARR